MKVCSAQNREWRGNRVENRIEKPRRALGCAAPAAHLLAGSPGARGGGRRDARRRGAAQPWAAPAPPHISVQLRHADVDLLGSHNLPVEPSQEDACAACGEGGPAEGQIARPAGEGRQPEAGAPRAPCLAPAALPPSQPAGQKPQRRAHASNAAAALLPKAGVCCCTSCCGRGPAAAAGAAIWNGASRPPAGPEGASKHAAPPPGRPPRPPHLAPAPISIGSPEGPVRNSSCRRSTTHSRRCGGRRAMAAARHSMLRRRSTEKRRASTEARRTSTLNRRMSAAATACTGVVGPGAGSIDGGGQPARMYRMRLKSGGRQRIGGGGGGPHARAACRGSEGEPQVGLRGAGAGLGWAPTWTSSGMISPEVALLLSAPLSGGEWMGLHSSPTVEGWPCSACWGGACWGGPCPSSTTAARHSLWALSALPLEHDRARRPCRRAIPAHTRIPPSAADAMQAATAMPATAPADRPVPQAPPPWGAAAVACRVYTATWGLTKLLLLPNAADLRTASGAEQPSRPARSEDEAVRRARGLQDPARAKQARHPAALALRQSARTCARV